MWVFGYGSLMWRVDFPYEEKILGYVKGFQRKFYQLSTDHRGTPENPGRVVTLIPGDSNSEVYGIAYRIRESDINKVVDHLDYREKGGYERNNVIFYPRDNHLNPFEITIYVATENNCNYGGHAEIDDIAKRVVNSIGPSGPNIDYVCNLANSMRSLFPDVEDDHLFSLEKKVLQLSDKNNK
ncbi:putative glutathione-specific gamma-glutamylcyclotransferase 2 [Anoplophora glabripennis]|nr:putative glutathione-specific gamma-glutamylcyclotransferase 2 [Anoplophora glabripennis]